MYSTAVYMAKEMQSTDKLSLLAISTLVLVLLFYAWLRNVPTIHA